MLFQGCTSIKKIKIKTSFIEDKEIPKRSKHYFSVVFFPARAHAVFSSGADYP